MRTRLRLSVSVLCLGTAVGSCGGGSPTAPTAANDYVGTWSGLIRLQACSVASRIECATVFLPDPAITITLNAASGGNVEGTVKADNYRFTVSGHRDADGSLSLTGTGTDAGFPGGAPITLTSWNTRDANGVMTGSFSFRSAPFGNNPAIDVIYMLDGVVKPGVAPPPFSGDRISLMAQSTRATRNLDGGFGYSGCGKLVNDARVSVTITFSVIPIGPDGADYPVMQIVPQGGGPSVVPARNVLGGCGFGFAQDLNLTHPVATQYRLRADFVYADGVTGSIESVATIQN